MKKNYGTAREATHENIIRRMLIASWITKATDTRSKYLILNRYSTGKMVTRTRLNITFIPTMPALLAICM
jgi:hypothetical protein